MLTSINIVISRNYDNLCFSIPDSRFPIPDSLCYIAILYPIR
ncbi:MULTISPECIES: hypothetical protein [Moorena]|nr:MULTISPECIES: hypothetical protein [Moorena]